MPQTTPSGPLNLISSDDLKFVPVTTDFAGLAADSLSDLPNLFAAIDADLAACAEIIKAEQALSPQLDSDLADAAEVLAEMDTDTFDSILGDLAGAASAADSMISAGNVDLPIGDFFNTNV